MKPSPHALESMGGGDGAAEGGGDGAAEGGGEGEQLSSSHSRGWQASHDSGQMSVICAPYRVSLHTLASASCSQLAGSPFRLNPVSSPSAQSTASGTNGDGGGDGGGSKASPGGKGG